MLDLLLVKEDKELIAELQELPETKLISKQKAEHYIVYRFNFKQGEGLSRRFEEICEKHPQNTLDRKSVV